VREKEAVPTPGRGPPRTAKPDVIFDPSVELSERFANRVGGSTLAPRKVVMWLTVLVLAALTGPVEAASLGKQCRQRCKEEVATCLEAARAHMVAEIPGRCANRVSSSLRRACRKATVERCRQEGLQTCLPFTTTSTTLPDYSGSWHFSGMLATNSCGGKLADQRSEDIEVIQDGASLWAGFGNPPRVPVGRGGALTPTGFYFWEDYLNDRDLCSLGYRLDASRTGTSLAATFTAYVNCGGCAFTYDGTLTCQPRVCACGTGHFDANGNGVDDCLVNTEVRDRLDHLTMAVEALRHQCAQSLVDEVDRLLADLTDFLALNGSFVTFLADAHPDPFIRTLQTEVARAAEVRTPKAKKMAVRAIQALRDVVGED
jgi:hypothetical protein